MTQRQADTKKSQTHSVDVQELEEAIGELKKILRKEEPCYTVSFPIGANDMKIVIESRLVDVSIHSSTDDKP